MKKIVIFGNSGSGKSTLAKQLSEQHQLAHFDLDTIAWLPISPPQRNTVEDSRQAIESFIDVNSEWVIEGCYSDLLELILDQCSEIIFLDLPIDDCIANAKQRPWEPHKYESKEAQDANLDMLVNWVAQYNEREDTFSHRAHLALFNGFSGKKMRYNSNHR